MTQLGVCLLVALAAAFVWTLPAFAGKKTLNEADLDRITAAGESQAGEPVPSAGTTAFATATPFSSHASVVALSAASQSTLQSLTVNNASGENLVATATNIAPHLAVMSSHSPNVYH